MLCSKCQSLSTLWGSEAATLEPYFYHNYKALKTSSRKCELCRVFTRFLPEDNLKRNLGRMMVAQSSSSFTPHRLVISPTQRPCEDRDSYDVTLSFELCGVTRRLVQPLGQLTICGKSRHGASPESQPQKDDSARLEDCTPYILERLHECISHHHMCRGQCVDPARAKMPTRVIDVRPAGESYVQLYETQGDLGCYIALSHCWGKDVSIKLVQANIEEFKNRIDMDRLPRTYQNAAELARRFNLRYIWIDSLCIIQDSPEDWKHEASNMASTYQNAFFTVAAAASKDGDGGLFPNTQEDEQRLQFEHGSRQLSVYRPRTYAGIETSPLNERAWVLQEWILSPRLVHFTSDGIYWECISHVASDNNDLEFYMTHNQQPVFAAEEEKYFSLRARAAITGSLTVWQSIYGIWARIVEDYTSRKLTFVSDKFVALAGLTTALENRVTDIPIAGLWRADLHLALLWGIESHSSLLSKFHPLSEYKAPEYKSAISGVPSWSWASIDGPVFYNVRHGARFVNDFEIMNVSVEWENDVPNTTLLGGRIKGQGYLRTFHVTDRGAHSCDLCFDAQAGSSVPSEEFYSPPGPENLEGCVIHQIAGQFESKLDLKEVMLFMPPYITRYLNIAHLLQLIKLEDGKEKPVGLLHGRGTLDRPLKRPKGQATCLVQALLVATELHHDPNSGKMAIPFANHVLFVESIGGGLSKPVYRRVGVGVFLAYYGYFEGLTPQYVEII